MPANRVHSKLSHSRADCWRWRHRPRRATPVGVPTNRRQFGMHPANPASITLSFAILNYFCSGFKMAVITLFSFSNNLVASWMPFDVNASMYFS